MTHKRDDAPGVTVFAQLYRRLLVVLPRDFRAAHGDDASDVFRDLYRAAFTRSGYRGVATLWISAIRQLVICALQERLARRRHSRHPAAFSVTGRRTQNMFVAFMEGVVQDLRFAVRAYIKKPGFSVTAILIAAVGIGATTTIFSVVDGVLLRGLPVPDVDRLVFFDNPSHSPLELVAWRDRTSSFAPVVGARTTTVDLTGDGEPQRLESASVTPGFLEVLGAQPLLGRLFTDEEYIGTPRVVLLSSAIWRTRWGAAPDMLGKTITLDGQPLVVAGILPPEFRPPASLVRGGRIDVWYPLDLANPELHQWGFNTVNVVGKLKPGTSIEAARAELDVLAEAMADEVPDYFKRRDGSAVPIEIIPLEQAGIDRIAPTLYMLLGAVTLMLLIACANLANLFLARGTARTREIALRAALGAGRGRIVGQLLTESTCLAVIGGALGIGFAYLGVAAFRQFTPGEIPRADMVAVDWRILAFAVTISLGTGVLFGMMPALHAARTDVNEVLKEGAGGLTVTRAGFTLRSILVVAEIAMALVLLVGAGLLFNSFMHLNRVDAGFETENMVILPVILRSGFSEEQRAQFGKDLVEKSAALPGVTGAAVSVNLPFVYYGGGRCCWTTDARLGRPREPGDPLRSNINPVSPNYFTVLGANLIQGREFEPGDERSDPSPAVINEAIAGRLFGEANALGRHFFMADMELVVVGVVGNIRQWGQSQDVGNQVYVPYARFGGQFPFVRLAVRTNLEAGAMAQTLRDVVWSIDPDLPVDAPVTMRQLVATSTAAPKFLTALLVTFATVAITLAAGGIYGSLLYLVGQRRREVGIRMAIGARAGDVLRLFVGHGLILTAIGIGLGLIGAVFASRLLATMVFGITPTDPGTFAAVALLLTAVATSASYLPARRATQTDPMTTLRTD